MADNRIMGNIVVVNGVNLTPYALEELLPGTGEGSLDWALKLGASLPGVEKKYLLLGDGGEGRDLPEAEKARRWGYLPVFRGRWTWGEFFGVLDELKGGGTQVFYLQGDAPLVCRDICLEMYEAHLKYFAQYSFADGYPRGMAPEILSASILPALKAAASAPPEIRSAPEEEAPEEPLLGPGTVFDLISRDINNYDLETRLSPRDLRLLRLCLTADTYSHLSLVKEIIRRNGRDEASILRIVEEAPEILRTFPAYVEVQITDGVLQLPGYLPAWPGVKTPDKGPPAFISPDDFSRLIDRVAAYSREGVINLGFRGEPSLHPRTAELADRVLRHPGLSLLIETSGLGWQAPALSQMAALDTRRMDWIVLLDAPDEPSYRRIRGEGFAEAAGCAERLRELFPRRVWVQAVRLKDEEETLEAFYRRWSGLTKNVIIQKYDDYCGRLPSRKVVDLSPLKRFPCWSLKRDLPVLLDGTVLLCREELENPRILGNLLQEEPEVIWQRGEGIYREHLRGNYPGLCGNCDEYYTFNY
ncbi:MAG: spiro-SPASM protein [Spirochaetales bacterium]|jgi:spiro-SPASM protein|nr:spiro-SPASM protein [Spirochaetales bacterium]